MSMERKYSPSGRGDDDDHVDHGGDDDHGDDDDCSHPENKTDLGEDQLKCAYVDVVDVSNAELSVKVFRPQKLQVRHHKLPELQDIVPRARIQVS